ncbi:hypothetical protein B0I35DRAFT_408775 [Stachybotrys elegans]|uniref:CENP-V/GFA domain-containing protein n=1 Tax=Stachybotrys elegans TaxID=80388 RepID=A0A8K0SSZ5_9HYPO|nr:hypothetical protein B0I35DRAFT_408775 [Stachybotrys elegans]
MPFPDSALTFTGGCSCGAVRYRVALPELSSRALSPFEPPEHNTRTPIVMACHCNDCRRATASVLAPLMIQIPSPVLTVSVLSPGESEPPEASGRFVDALAPDYDAEAADASRPPYRPAMDVLRADGKAKGWLRFFHSEECGLTKSRAFCGRCGTQVSYHLALIPEYCHDDKLPADYSDIFDINLGTVDREFLDKDWFTPAHEVHFKLGTRLGRMVSATAMPLKEVPKLQEYDEVVGDEELAELATA